MAPHEAVSCSRMSPKNLILPCAIASLVASPLSAAVTYVDAEGGPSGNTYETGGSLANTSWFVNSDSASELDDQWRFRSAVGRGVGGDVFHGRTSGTDQMPELTVEIGGLPDGTYNLYVFFWDDDDSENNTSNIDAGLVSGSLVTYGGNSPTGVDNPLANGEAAVPAPLASTLSYSGQDPTTASLFSDWNLHAAPVGQAIVSGGSTIQIYVDHSQPVDGLSSTAQVRSLFDGVGYELVPEPSTTLLGALGTLFLFRRRRS